MRLCQMCNLANNSAFPEGECFVCGNAAMKTDTMLEHARALLLESNAKSFSISTSIPRDWLAREERAFDERIGGAESIKNLLNRRIASELRNASGAEYSADGECRLVFDYSKGNVELQMNDLFIFGRYKKLAAGLSQSRWICSKCSGKGCGQCGGRGRLYESVEERIGGPAAGAAGAKAYVLHASGREDVDATNSAGRPFVLELKEAQRRDIGLDALAMEIVKKGDVSVHDLALVPRGFVEVVTESHFDKAYEADVEFEREIENNEIALIHSLEGRTILQQTPARVAHRRADLIRHRKVKHIEVVRREEDGKTPNPKLATLIIKAEAGTYIKELISGDRGRTNPSISGLLGMKAECKRLEVTMIDDGFLDLCLGSMK